MLASGPRRPTRLTVPLSIDVVIGGYAPWLRFIALMEDGAALLPH